MANITRIKNNQITDSTITYSKIATGTLTGSVFNSNLTLNSNVTIVGNLSVTGNSAVVNAINTTINDPLVVFNNGYTGSPSYDIGVIANRNLNSLAPYGSVNMGFVWKESDQQWQAIATTETGTTTGSINNSGWANVRVGNLVSVSSNVTGNQLIGGNLDVTGLLTLTTASVGGLQAVAIGNVTPGTAAFTTGTFSSTLGVTGELTFTTAVGGGLQAVAIGNVTPGTGAFTTLSASSTLGVTGVTTLTTATVGGLQAVAIGNVTPGSGAFTTLSASSTLGVTGELTFTTAVGGGLQAVAIGNVTPGSGAFTTLTSTSTIIASGNIVAASGTASSSTTSGALVVAGGAGISGAVYAGSAYDNGTRVITGVSSTGAGNITVSGTNPSITLELTATGPGAAQWGSAARIPYFSTDAYGRVVAAANVDLNTVAVTNLGNTTEITANSAVGLTGLSLTATGVSAGNYGSATSIPTIEVDSKGRVLSLTSNSVSASYNLYGTSGVSVITSTGTGGGSFDIIGSYGVTTNASGSTLTIATPQDLQSNANPTFNNATLASLQAAAIGNVTPGTAAFTTGTFSSTLGVTGATTLTTASVGGLQAVAIGNVTPGTAAFTTASWNTATGGSFQGVIGNVTPAAGTFTSLNATSLTLAAINGTVIGNVTPAAGTFTSLTASSITAETETVGGLQAVAIGNVTPGTAVFTTLTASTWANITATTESTNSTTGALVVAGGVGIDKNLNVGGSVVITGNLTVNGDVTTVNAATLDVEDLNITVAKGAGSAAAANGAGLTVDGANATLTYANADDSWNTNKLTKVPSAKVTDSTASTSTTTGALIVTGGVGIAGAVYAGSIQATPIGDTTASTGTFTTLTAQTETVGGLQAVAIGNVTPGTAVFTTAGTGGLQAVAIGNVTPGTAAFTTATTGGLQAVAIGNVTPGTGAFTSVTVGETSIGDGTVGTGTLTAGTANVTYLNVGNDATISGVTSMTTATAGGLQAVAIGNVTPGTAAFTTATAGGLQAVAIGNVTPGTGAFTTLTGASFQGVIGNATPAAGTFTTLFANSASFASINNTPIGNATPSTGAFTSVTVGETSIGDGTIGTGTLTAGTGNLTYLNVGNNATISGVTSMTTATAGGLQAVAIGNVTPGTGAFTTLTSTGTIISSGNIVADATTNSTSNVTGAVVVKGGIGVAGNINAGTPGIGLHTLRGNVLIGYAPALDVVTPLLVNLNTAAAIPGSAQIHLVPGDGRSAAIMADSMGTGVSTSFVGRHTRGTVASPAAVQAGDEIASFRGAGYGSTGFTNGSIYTQSGMTVYAAENYTDTAHGTKLALEVIPTGSNSAVAGLTIFSTGNVVIPATTASVDYVTGALVVNGGAGFNGNVHTNGDVHASGSFNGSDVAITGQFSTLATTDTTAPGVGTLVTPGGASFGGNAYIAKNLYIGPSSFEKAIAVATIIGVSNGSEYAQMAMVNSSAAGSSDFAAYASNGDDAGGWVDMGIAGPSFSDPAYTITKPQDGYLFTRPVDSSAGGNLVIGTSEAGSHNHVVIGVGSFAEESEVARFTGNSSNSGTFVIKLPTNAAPAANTGALQVWGGASFSSNLYVGGAVTINGAQTANFDFKVAGNSSTNLLWARPSATYDQVIIGNTLSASSLVGGAKLVVNSTDSVVLPKGTTGQRPGTSGFSDVAGMFRYNTTLNSLEFYNGTIWSSIGSNFTVITDEQFNGNGVDTEFTLADASTTAACMVSINGVVQIPTLAYSISGTTLTFTEAPANGDLIDVRVLVTTQTVTGITSPNGFMGFTTTDSQAYITAGTSAATTVTYWDTSGAQVGSIPNVSVTTANVASTIDSFATATYRTAKYVVQATNGSNFQAMEALVVHDGTTASIVPYGVVQTGSNLGILTATVSSGNVLVQFVPAISSTTVRLSKDYLLV